MMPPEDTSENKRSDDKEKKNGLDLKDCRDWKTEALEIQQGFYEKLGDRTFDFFEADQRWALETKIGFALFGEPTEEKEDKNNGSSKKINEEDKEEKEDKNNGSSKKINEEDKEDKNNGYSKKINEEDKEKKEDKNNGYSKKINEEDKEEKEDKNNGYSKKINEEIKRICDLIYDLQNGYSEVTMAFLFVIGEVEKKLFCIPVFKILIPSADIIFLDQYGRVYQSWENFKGNNKLPKCIICYPKDGIYKGDKNDKVLISFDPSPACRIGSRTLSVLDTASTVVTVGATVVGIASMFVPVFAPIAIAAAVGGTGSGIYGIARGSHQIHDRRTHKQSISLKDSTARNCWLSIFGSAFGVGSGLAVKGMVNMAASGQVLGKVGRISVNLLNYGSLTINGLGVANGLANLIEKNEKGELGALDILQFTTSVLFFTNAAMNTKTASSIIKEVQSDIITDFRSDLSKRRENAFEKVMKKSGGEGTMQDNARIIKGIKNVASKDEFFRMLIRGQKQSKTTRLNDDGFLEVKGVAYIDTPIELQTHVRSSGNANIGTSATSEFPNSRDESKGNFKRTSTMIVVEKAFIILCKKSIKLANGVELDVTDKVMRFLSELLTKYFPKTKDGSVSSENITSVIIQSERFAQESGCSTKEDYFDFTRFLVIYKMSLVKDMEKEYLDAKAKAKEILKDDFDESKFDQEWGIQDPEDRENSFLSIINQNESNEELKSTFHQLSSEVTALNNDGGLKFCTNYVALNEYYHSYVIDGYERAPREFFEVVRQVANDDKYQVRSEKDSERNSSCITFSNNNVPVVVTVTKCKNGIFLETVSFKEL